MNLYTLTAQELRALKPECTPVLLPLGPTQPHGPHLPLGTSFLLAEGIAAAALPHFKRLQMTPLVAPTLPWSPAELAFGLPGCLSVNARVFSDLVYQVGQAFHREGFRCFVPVSHHLSLEHVKALGEALGDLAALPDFLAIDPLTPWLLGSRPPVEESLRRMGLDPTSEVHGDVIATSALLQLDPGLVKQELLPTLAPYLASLSWETLKGHFTLADMGAVDGYIGTPAAADARLGEWYLDLAGRVLAEATAQAMAGKPPPSLPMVVRLLMRLVDLDDAG